VTDLLNSFRSTAGVVPSSLLERTSVAVAALNTKLDLFGMEVEDDEFFGFVRSNFPLAPPDGVESGLS